MSGIYVVAGALIGFTNVVSDVIPNYRPGIAAALIGYGVLRFVLWWRRHKQALPASGDRA
ncbi:MAG: hypothetical protein IPK99_04950 [Flavobacteriales bacterium]|nr:hypothetical protein [Flavobacteriales bacterium]